MSKMLYEHALRVVLNNLPLFTKSELVQLIDTARSVLIDMETIDAYTNPPPYYNSELNIFGESDPYYNSLYFDNPDSEDDK